MNEEVKREVSPSQVKRLTANAAKLQARNEALRAENADIDAIAEEYHLSDRVVSIIKDWKSGQFSKTRIMERNNSNIRTVSKWALIVDPKSAGRGNLQQVRRIEKAIRDNPDTSDRFLADLLENVSAPQINYYRNKMKTTRQGRKSPTRPRRTPLSLPVRRAVLADLMQNPRPPSLSIVKKHDLGERQNLLRLARQYWIPMNPSEKVIDVALFLSAAQEIIGRYLLDAPYDRQLTEQPGWISQLEGLKPSPQSEEFRTVDSVLTDHLREAGVKGPEDLQSRTDAGRRLILRMPEQIFLALQFALAARLVIFNRRNVRRLSNASAPDPSPSRKQLEALIASMVDEGRISAVPSQEPASTDTVISEARNTFLKALGELANSNEETINRDINAAYMVSVDPETRASLVTPADLEVYSRIFEREELTAAARPALAMFHVLATSSPVQKSSLSGDGLPSDSKARLIIDPVDTFWPPIQKRLELVVSGQGIGRANEKEPSEATEARQTAANILKAITGNDIEPPEVAPEIPMSDTAITGHNEGSTSSQPVVLATATEEITANAATVRKASVPDEGHIPAVNDSKPATMNTHSVANGSTKPNAHAKKSKPVRVSRTQQRNDSSFVAQFWFSFPTLAQHIPSGALESREAFWRSVSQYWPDQSKFDQRLDELLSTRQIYDHTGINLNVLVMTFVREFGQGKKAADLLPEPEFVEQIKRMDDLRDKCKQFARLMELYSGKLNDAGHISVDRESLQRALAKRKYKPDTIAQMLSLYSLAASPVVNGVITPIGDLVMTRMKIPYEEVATIFDELPPPLEKQEPATRKQHASRPVQPKSPSTSVVSAATAA